MSSVANSEWGDIAATGELFGGDFFGDDLMDMYAAIGDAPPATTSALAAAANAAAAAPPPPVDADGASHPGLLIAMNAAAMDGGLSPLGSAGPDQFVVPAPAPSDGAAVAGGGAGAPPPAAVKAEPAAPAAKAPPPLAVTPPAPTVPAPTPSPPGAAAAPVPTPAAVTSAPATKLATATATPATKKAAPAPKRPAPAAGAAAARNPPKKARAPPTAAVPRAKVAATGGIKLSLPPGAAAAAASRPLGRAVSSSSITKGAMTKPALAAQVGLRAPPKKAPASASARTAAVPRSKMPVGGGINHTVVARPSTVRSAASVSATRGMVPAPQSFALKRPTAPVLKAPAAPKKSDAPRGNVPPGVIRAKSEADFKDVASAAVSSLIQSATTGPLARAGFKPAPTAPPAVPGSVDVSTAHVHALTSQNWVTACNPVPAPGPAAAAASAGQQQQQQSACDKAARNARRAALTQEERAKQNRDRNREHARNTRLRKKAYVEELKRTLTELVARRDAADLERRHAEQREREQREVRFRVMEEFLKLRGRNEPNAARWVAILEDGFTFALPRTPFRRTVDVEKTRPNDVNGNGASAEDPPPSPTEQVLRGAQAVMEDSRHLSAYLQTLGGSANAITPVQLAYHCDRKKFFMDGNIAFLHFTAVTVGAPRESSLRGSARATFSPASNKLISVDVSFDAAAFLRQVEAHGEGGAGAAAAAQAAEADALLDSLQMPQIFAGENKGGNNGAGGGSAGDNARESASVSADDGESSSDGSAPSNA